MWWLFKKVHTSNSIVEYAYSRESEETTGSIKYDKANQTVVSFAPCLSDGESTFGRTVAISKFINYVAKENYPDIRRVVIG